MWRDGYGIPTQWNKNAISLEAASAIFTTDRNKRGLALIEINKKDKKNLTPLWFMRMQDQIPQKACTPGISL